MLFDTSVRRELARSFGATLVVLLTIVLTLGLVRTVGAAAQGRVSAQDVLLLLGFWYENRSSVLVGSISKELEFSVKSLLDSQRWGTYR